jgi:hypothetical protein
LRWAAETLVLQMWLPWLVYLFIAFGNLYGGHLSHWQIVYGHGADTTARIGIPVTVGESASLALQWKSLVLVCISAEIGPNTLAQLVSLNGTH